MIGKEKLKGSAPFRPGAPQGNQNAKGNKGGAAQKDIKTLCVLVSMNQSYLISWMIQKKICLAKSKQTQTCFAGTFSQ